MAAGLLLVRVVFGALMAGHGAQKLWGWFGGYGLSGTGAFFDQLGFRPGRRFAAAAAAAEIVGGLLVFLGLGGPIGPAITVSVMIVAIASVHWGHGLFAATNGVEIPLLYGAAAAALALTGPGAYSIDAFLGWLGWSTATTSLTALAVAALGALGNLVMRDVAPVSSKIAA